MRENRVLRLVLAAALMVAVSALAFLPRESSTPTVDWVNVDETNPVYPPESPGYDYDGDGTPDPVPGDGNGDGDGDPGDGEDGSGEEPGGSGPEGGGDAGDPEVSEPGAREGDSGGLLGLSFPAQAGISAGLIGLAFLALLPGRRMPEHLR